MKLYGLDVLCSDAIPEGTVHCITPPPQRCEGESDDAYEARYVEWQRKVTTWQTSWREVGPCG